MGLEMWQARQLADTLETELVNRSAWVERADRYYRGDHPLRFASGEFREYFAGRYRGFADNWVQIVADSPVERLTVTGFQPYGSPQGKADPEAERVWQVNACDCDSQLGFTGAVMAGRCFVLVWGDPSDPETPEITFEDAGQCIVAYEPGSRYKRRAALKRWQDGWREYATLYTADEVWKFERPLNRMTETPVMAGADEEMHEWLPRETPELNPQPNPMHLVPMVELPNRPLLTGSPYVRPDEGAAGNVVSDVSPVLPLQDAVNLLWAQMFTASDFAALPQRYVIGAERPTVPIYDDEGRKVGEKEVDLKEFMTRRLFWVTGDAASAGSWPAANLAVYTDVIETAIGHIAAQTRTPQHYLIGKMANLSSDALIAAEAGLVKRTMEKQLWFGQALREVQRLVALAQGNEQKAAAYRAGKVLWQDVESRSQGTLTAALTALKGIGWPFQDLARRYGLTPAEVAQLMAMRKQEAIEDPVLAMLGTREPMRGTAGEPEFTAAPVSDAPLPVPPEGPAPPGTTILR